MGYEEEMLSRRMIAIEERSEKVLKSLLGENRTLTWLSRPDKIRLMILLVWEERYHVSVEEILHFLIPYFQTFTKGHKKKKTMGLPVRVSTLVSKTTELILKKHLEEELPSEVRIRLSLEVRRELLLRQVDRDELISPQREKSLKDFETLEEWQKYYTRKTERKRNLRREQLTEMKANTLPYRGNPWR